MAGDAQIGFNINNVPFGKHSISRPAKKNIPPCQDLLNPILGDCGRVEFLKQKSKQMVFGKYSRS